MSDAFEAIAEGLGVPCALHHYWGHTLFHPQDALSALAAAAAKGRKGSDAAAEGSTAEQLPQRLNADPALFDAIPAVMTDFRKAGTACSLLRGIYAVTEYSMAVNIAAAA